jgi:hypothetical protein
MFLGFLLRFFESFVCISVEFRADAINSKTYIGDLYESYMAWFGVADSC